MHDLFLKKANKNTAPFPFSHSPFVLGELERGGEGEGMGGWGGGGKNVPAEKWLPLPKWSFIGVWLKESMIRKVSKEPVLELAHCHHHQLFLFPFSDLKDFKFEEQDPNSFEGSGSE